MSIRNAAFIAALVLAFAVIAAGCGDSEETSTTSETLDSSTTASTNTNPDPAATRGEDVLVCASIPADPVPTQVWARDLDCTEAEKVAKEATGNADHSAQGWASYNGAGCEYVYVPEESGEELRSSGKPPKDGPVIYAVITKGCKS